MLTLCVGILEDANVFINVLVKSAHQVSRSSYGYVRGEETGQEYYSS